MNRAEFTIGFFSFFVVLVTGFLYAYQVGVM